MRSGASKPILRVVVVRFASVQDGVNVTAVTCLNFLCNGMSGVEMIVPEQYHGARKIGANPGKICFCECLDKLFFQWGKALHASPRTRSQAGRFRRRHLHAKVRGKVHFRSNSGRLVRILVRNQMQ